MLNNYLAQNVNGVPIEQPLARLKAASEKLLSFPWVFCHGLREDCSGSNLNLTLRNSGFQISNSTFLTFSFPVPSDEDNTASTSEGWHEVEAKKQSSQ